MVRFGRSSRLEPHHCASREKRGFLEGHGPPNPTLQPAEVGRSVLPVALPRLGSQPVQKLRSGSYAPRVVVSVMLSPGARRLSTGQATPTHGVIPQTVSRDRSHLARGSG